MKKKDKQVVLYGTGKDLGEGVVPQPLRTAALLHHAVRGVVPWLERRHSESRATRAREQIEGYMREVPCPAAVARDPSTASLAVTIGGQNIYEVGELSIRKASSSSASLELSERDRMIAERVRRRSTSASGSCSTSARLLEPQPVVGHVGRR